MAKLASKSGKITKQEKSSKQANQLALKIKERALAKKKEEEAEEEEEEQRNNTSDSDSESESTNDQSDAKENVKVEEEEEEEEESSQYKSFADFGLAPELIEACQQLKFTKPTPIQAEAIPWGLKGKDLIGLAQTGSGKTAAFAIPILQELWEARTPYFACVLSPTRELAYQIKETFDALGSGMACKTVCIVGGVGMMDQARDLMKKPHIIVATPGRLLDHLEHTKGFSLKALKYLVLDEADRLLELEFGPALDRILELVPKKRRTFLFSATMTSKVAKLQRASLEDPVRCAVNDKYTTVDSLIQTMIVAPSGSKDTHLIRLLDKYTGKAIIIFTRTVANCQRTAILGKILGFPIVPLHGQLSQSKRLGALNKFKSGSKQILVATDVAARGLDIPSVDLVINYDMPTDSKTYIHRVGRTARAGKSGRSVSLVTQYDLELLLRIEQALDKKLAKEVVDNQEIAILHKTVDKAFVQAIHEFKLFQENNKQRGKHDKRGDNKDREER
ncbi:RNA-dependent ATPase [Saccharomycopsis crataegensis]|uniref:ATP-dependent rRNA helicase RRP3 n=1 Tax=Saccharomycopsis crataegensis TaxID=43959 RepID=A0AAV5QSG0_9ASCO|nr:RNA-dependent ATPase [Saccharomycopsis crataegensis]